MHKSENILSESDWIKKLVNSKLSFRNYSYRGGYDLLHEPEVRNTKMEILFMENHDFQFIETVETKHTRLGTDKKNSRTMNRIGTWSIVPESPGKGILILCFIEKDSLEMKIEIDAKGHYWLDGHRYCLEKYL